MYCQKNPLKIPHVRPPFIMKELSWLRIKSLLLMTQLLVIGFSKAIRGKGLSRNKPTCENAVAYTSMEVRRSGLWASGRIRRPRWCRSVCVTGVGEGCKKNCVQCAGE